MFAPHSYNDVEHWDYDVDVIVIGQGIAGTCAALEAHRAGANVLIMDRASGGGGASALSSGIFYLGGGTEVQKACGYEDTPEDMYNFISASMDPLDPNAAHDFAFNSLEHFNWLEAQGVPFERTCFKDKAVFLLDTTCLLSTGNEKVWPYNLAAKPAPRGHKTAGSGEHAGAAAMQALLARCEDEQVPALYDCKVDALVQDETGRIRGVHAVRDGVAFYAHAAKGVIVSTGGFNYNPDMVAKYFPRLSPTAEPLGTPHNTGEGVMMAEAAGAVTDGMEGLIATASIYPPGQLIKGIIVNNRGERFVAEDSYHGRTASFIMEQPDQEAFLIVDSEVFAYPEIESARHELIDGWDSIEDMEKGLPLPEGSLQSTLERYNRDAAAGEDTLLHKHVDWLKPLDKGPWAAFNISFRKSIYLYITLGGLRTNRHAQALDDDGHAIAGLYAAGACSAHIPRDGKSYASGMSLGPGSYFGRQAGLHAAQAESIGVPEVRKAG